MIVHLAISVEVVMEGRKCPPPYIFSDVGPAPVVVENSRGDTPKNTYTSPTLVKTENSSGSQLPQQAQVMCTMEDSSDRSCTSGKVGVSPHPSSMGLLLQYCRWGTDSLWWKVIATLCHHIVCLCTATQTPSISNNDCHTG